jgi:acetyl-CoA synthetase
MELTSSSFLPLATFQKNAHVQSMQLFQEAQEDRLAFWGKQAACLEWFQPWNQVLKWNPPHAQWFLGGQLNACYNCVDRHLTPETKDKQALIWESETGETRTLTYQELHKEVSRLGNGLKSLGISKGECVAIYLPSILEAIIAMLACARIGAIHTVIFGGFSAEALKDRLLDAEAKLLITADVGFRKGAILSLKAAADQALQECPAIQ